jgi:membrane associated rhomboid family serine protease
MLNRLRISTSIFVTFSLCYGIAAAGVDNAAHLGGLAAGWLVTQVGSAPLVIMVNGLLLASIATFFLIRGHGLKDV